MAEEEPSLMNLDSLRNWMSGEDCVVVGCGPSARSNGDVSSTPHAAKIWEDGPCDTRQFRWFQEKADSYWTIGCNRSVIYCSPNFAVCIEPSRDKSCWNVVAETSPFIVFTHIERPHPRAVLIPSKDVRTWFSGGIEPEGDRLRLSQSPFFATAAAVLLGFETIGLIGIDLTEDRWPDVRVENEAYGRLAELASGLGSRIINLNPDSRLTALPMGTWEEIGPK